jgi:hypothetical protein
VSHGPENELQPPEQSPFIQLRQGFPKNLKQEQEEGLDPADEQLAK